MAVYMKDMQGGPAEEDSMKNMMRIAGLTIVILVSALWLTGCIEWTEKTRIHANGKCSERITINTNPIFAEGLRADAKKKEFENMGYTFEMKNEDDKVLLILSREFNSFGDMYKAERLDPISGIEGTGKDTPRAKGELKVQDYFFVKTLVLKETRPPAEKSGENPADPKQKELEAMREQIGQNLFTYKRVIEMPGPIISSNAKTVDKKTNEAAWDVSFDDMQKGSTFEVTSRIINMPAIIGASLVIMVLIIVLILAVVKMKKKQPGKVD